MEFKLMVSRGVFCLFLVLPIAVFSQETTPKVKFGGFVKVDAFFDSRQTVSAREGHFLLWPAADNLDANGDDINAQPNFNILAVQTRLKAVAVGPEAFGAKSSAVVEGAFFGHSNADINGFRLRHAFVKLAWANSVLIAGQYWNPMFVTQVFPGTVSFNTGVPFQPFSRNPQIRLTKKVNNFNLIGVLYSQRDFSGTGPNGAGSKYLRNAALPTMHAQIQGKTGNLFYGAGVDFKVIRPELSTSANAQTYKSSETLSSLSYIAFAKAKLNKLTLKMEGLLGQNIYDQLSIGGYAVSGVDAATGESTFTNYNTFSFWSEISIGKKIEKALFIGLTKNRGTSDDIAGPVYARGSNIDQAFRIAPRLQVNSGKVRYSTELEFTSTAYGKADSKGLVKDTTSVANIRLLFALYYFF